MPIHEASMPIRVAIVEDNLDFRMGTSLILRTSPGFEVAGEFANAEAFFVASDRIDPDVVLMDISLPGMSGIEATRLLREKHPRFQVIVLTMHQDDDSLFVRMWAAALAPLVSRNQ